MSQRSSRARRTLLGAPTVRSLGGAFLALLLGGCGAGGEPTVTPSPPLVTLDGVTFRAWRGGDLAASGTAERVRYRRSVGTVEADSARVELVRPGSPDLMVAAPELSGDLGARSWKARGGVVLTRSDATARTPSARWSESEGKVRGDETVEVLGPGYRLSGPAFEADPASGDIEIRGGVRLLAGGERP